MKTVLGSSFRYEFPSGNPDPFDTGFEGNYFAFANGYSNLSKTLNDFSYSSLEKNIPIGYKTIIICQRLFFFEKGKEIHSWPAAEMIVSSDNEFAGKYLLTTSEKYEKHIDDWNRTIQSLVIYNPEAKDASLQSSVWDTLAGCKQMATDFSSGFPHPLLLSKVIDSISWH